jgi:methionyl-tRNA synthetase
MPKFYITTTLPYVNADPHIGHALEFIQADAITRFQRFKLGKENVFFNLGTDEHGLKMFTKANEEGISPQEFTTKYAKRFQEFCASFDIGYDFFYRTSESYHYGPAQKFWEASLAKGDIYKKEYTGLYCVGCEEFKTEKDLVDGKCPLHDKAPISYAEENYFFRLSKYTKPLLAMLDSNPEFVKPASKHTELYNFIAQGLEDISISRLKKNLPWGVPVPNDPDQVMYVWFDALTNYVNVLGYGTDAEKLKTWWPGIQLCGPDNLRFQGAIWQGMLLSAGLPHTKQILVHGMVLGPDGRKMSKTLGNVISPFEQLEKFGAEVVRYYLLSGLTTFGDSIYSESDLISKYNSELADTYGNLLNRVIHLSKKLAAHLDPHAATDSFKAIVNDYRQTIHNYYETNELSLALQHTYRLAILGNEYIDERKPWKQTDEVQLTETLNNLAYLLHTVTDNYSPALPESTAKARQALMDQEPIVLFPKIEVNQRGD